MMTLATLHSSSVMTVGNSPYLTKHNLYIGNTDILFPCILKTKTNPRHKEVKVIHQRVSKYLEKYNDIPNT